MDDDEQNGGAVVVVRPPGSDTCGMIVNYDADGESGKMTATAAVPPPPPPPVAAAAAAATTTTTTTSTRPAFGVPAARPAPPYGVHLYNNNNNPIVKGQQLKGPGNPDHRTRRPRRGKRKSKKIMPYTKDRMMFRYKAVAPNNTNQFLMDDHNDLDIDKKLSARYDNENGRTRNSSYTSIESDGEHMYSSSDEDGTSIQKEFIDTYRLVQEEQLAGLTKNELTQRVIELEEKIQVLEAKRYRKNIMTYLNDLTKSKDDDDEDSIDPEEYRLMQIQIRELTTQNKMLQTEIETLKQVKTRTNTSDSSIDSESSSDSSDSSSSSSDGQEIEMKFLLRSNGRDDHSSKDD